jgi:hypothetical protein
MTMAMASQDHGFAFDMQRMPFMSNDAVDPIPVPMSFDPLVANLPDLPALEVPMSVFYETKSVLVTPIATAIPTATATATAVLTNETAVIGKPEEKDVDYHPEVRETNEDLFVLWGTKLQNEKTPFGCRLCSKTFTQKIGLVNHLRIHAGLKFYQCSQCNKSFTQKCNLVRHEGIHKPDRPKPFECSICNKAFPRKWGLKVHMKSHVTPYSTSSSSD